MQEMKYASNDRVIRHSLGKIPEMIWVKNRTIDYSWDVYHKGMNGGTNPWTLWYALKRH